MLLTYVREHRSITGPVAEGQVSNFIVLTGLNGSGKSQLLEAIELGAVTVDGLPDPSGTKVRRFGQAQLAVVSEGEQQLSSYRDTWVNFQNTVAANIGNMRAQYPSQPAEFINQQMLAMLVSSRQASAAALTQLQNESGKLLIDMDTDDFREHAPLIVGIRDPFQLSLSELFLSYHSRKTRNQFYRFQMAEDGRSDGVPLTDAEFLTKYGPNPWDLLTETLHTVGLKYTFDPPRGLEENVAYTVRLIDDSTGVKVPTDQLSSGEKTLLAVAMSLFTGSSLKESIELPDVLLLDEADASLHPSMVQSLLNVIQQVFVDTYGVKVILTTHSPTTVALAPEQSLYVMRRSESPRMVPAATRDAALKSLTVGLSTLAVHLDNKRVVFVESEYDEACYQELYRLNKNLLASDQTLEFVASGKGGKGDSDAVKYLVSALRSNDSTNVFGIVDRDGRGGAADGILFNPERYSIENLALDPLILAVFLIRSGVRTAEELGLPSGVRHHQIETSHTQAIVDAISNLVVKDDYDTQASVVSYVGGFTINMPSFWLNTRGHDLEDRVVEVFPQLRSHGRRLDQVIISQAYGDHPNFLPSSALELFRSCLQ